MTRFLLLPLLSTTLGATCAWAANAACQPLIDAETKLSTVPFHLYMSETAVFTGGKARSSETIYLGNTIYINVKGKWQISKMTRQDIQHAKKEAPPSDTKMTCSQVRDESVNGEAAILYSSHSETPEDKIDTQIWISKSRGLPLKHERDIDVGGKFGKSHATIRYEYTNVQAPPLN